MLVLYTFLKDDDTVFLDQCLQSFPAWLRLSINAYQQKKDRQQRIAGKLLLKKAVKHFHLGDEDEWVSLYQATLHQPRIKTLPLNFSIAYSADICVLSADTQQLNGIDVEYKKNQVEISLYQDFLHPEEHKVIQNSATSAEQFYHFWTAKEAVVKAAGVGITQVNLAEINTVKQPIKLNNQAFYIQQINIHQNYVIQLASEKPSNHIELKQVILG